MLENKGTILIIDDDDSLRTTLALILQKAGYKVTTAESAEAALAILQVGCCYDCAFLDLKMPGMNGIELLMHLKDHYPDMPVIILTAHASLDSSIQALRFGAKDYLIKPISPEEVLQKVDQVLDDKDHPRKRREVVSKIQDLLEQLGEIKQKTQTSDDMINRIVQNDPLRFLRRGHFVLDLETKRVTFVDQILEITPTSFDYLAVLIRHAPNPVSYETLVMEAQGYHVEPDEARDIARWRVHELRKVIEDDPREPKYVLTVRGYGYQLAE